MVNATYVSNSGLSYTFGVDGSTICDIDVYKSVDVDLSTAQGFSQIGDSVQGKSVKGRNISITGVIFRSIPKRKDDMRSVFTPLSSGKLIYNGKYFSNVYVKSPPTFSPQKTNGKFSIRLYAPFPYFFSVDEESSEIGSIIPQFHFPIDYSAPHSFGVRSTEKYKNVINAGNVAVPFSATITATATSQNPAIANLNSGKFLKLNGELSPGDVVKIYRDTEFVLRAELFRNNESSDILHWIDESSDLFELDVGDNVIAATDDSGGGITARLSFNWAVSAIYED